MLNLVHSQSLKDDSDLMFVKKVFCDSLPYMIQSEAESQDVMLEIWYDEDEQEVRKIQRVILNMPMDCYEWKWKHDDNEDARTNYPLSQIVEDAVNTEFPTELNKDKDNLIKSIVKVITDYCHNEEVEGLY